MIVNILYNTEQHALSEMLNTVPSDLLMRRLNIYLKNRFQKYTSKIREALEKARVYRSSIEVSFNDELSKVMHDDPGFWDDVKAFCESMGYSCGGCNDPDYILLVMSKSRVPMKKFINTKYNYIYVRYSVDSPDLIGRIGFRQKGHFYAYAVGRDVSLIYRISQELGLKYTERDILDRILTKMRVEKHLFGRYVYAFSYRNTSYIDPCDSCAFPDVGEKEIMQAAESLRNTNRITLRDIEYALLHVGAELEQPVTIHESIPPANIVFLRDTQDDEDDDFNIAEESDKVDTLILKMKEKT